MIFNKYKSQFFILIPPFFTLPWYMKAFLTPRARRSFDRKAKISRSAFSQQPFCRAFCRAFPLRARGGRAVPHPASAIRGFRPAPALRGGGDHLLRAAAGNDVPHRSTGAYAGTAAGAAGAARCFPGCGDLRPPGGVHRAGGYTALSCRVYRGGRYLHIAALKTHTKKPNICKKQVFSFLHFRFYKTTLWGTPAA